MSYSTHTHTNLKSKNLFRKSTDPLVLEKIPKILIKMVFMLGFIAYKCLATLCQWHVSSRLIEVALHYLKEENKISGPLLRGYTYF